MRFKKKEDKKKPTQTRADISCPRLHNNQHIMKLVTSLLRMNNQRLFLSEWTKYKLYNIGNCAETLPLYGLTLLGTS